MASDFAVRWTFLRNWSVYGDLGVGYAQSQTSSQTYTNSDLTGAIIGADSLWVDVSGVKLIPDIWARFPLDNNTKSATSVETSEGDTEFAGKLILRYDRTHWKNFGSLGYISRDGSRSSLATYAVGSQVGIWS